MARICCPALVAICLLAAAPPAHGAGRQLQVDAPTLLALGAKMEAGGDARQAIQIYRALEADAQPEVRAEARYRQAKLLAAAGKRIEAAVLLRRVIDDQPQAAPVRLELAGLLQQLGDDKSALRELRALGTLDLPPNVARFVDRMTASLRASRPFSFQVELALAPDSNINRATRSDTLGTVLGDFTFDKESQAKSGVGAAVRGFVQGRLSLSKDVNLAAHASVDSNVYRHSEFNDITLEVAGGPEFTLGPARIAAEAGVGQQWYGMKPFQRSARLSASARFKVGNVSQLRVDGLARWSDNLFNDLQDGRGLAVALRYERALTPTTTLSLAVSGDRFKAREDAYSTKSWNFGATLYRDVGRMTLELGADIGRLKADERLALLPEAREDKLMRLRAGAVFRQLSFAGFSPTMRVVMERNRSSVEYYDFKRTRTEFGVSRAF